MPVIWAENPEKVSMSIRSKLMGFCLISGLLWACDSTDPQDQIPPAIVNETINLTNQQYQSLQFIGGTVAITGGVRGILIYRATIDEYRAFERNCSYQPLDVCALVEVESSGLFMIDSCCTSTFNFDGFPTGGPASLPLRVYNTSLQGNFLVITN